MRLREFDLRADASFAEHREVSVRLLHVSEAVHQWIRDQRIDAPFAKLLLALSPIDERVFVVDSICHATVGVARDSLLSEESEPFYDNAFAAVLRGLDAIEKALKWSDRGLYNFVHSLTTKRPVCDQPIHRLSGALRDGRSWTTRLVMTERSTEITAELRQDGILNASWPLARSDRPAYPEDLFPATSLRILASAVEYRGAKKSLLVRLEIPETADPSRDDPATQQTRPGKSSQ